MTSNTSRSRWRAPRRGAALAGICLAASACAAGPAAATHGISLFGNNKTAPPLVPTLSRAQAAHLPVLSSDYGPAYDNGRILGLAVSYPGCEQVKGAEVTETAVTVKVTVLGTPWPKSGICPANKIITTVGVRLPDPLGHRTEIHG